MNDRVDGVIGQDLWDRADRVLPGGMIYLSRSARFAGDGVLPGFIASANGCRIKDADGKEYIDFLCGNGPNILGYRHPEVDLAAQQQAGLMDLASFYPEALVTFSERLLNWATGLDWVVHVKNGSDALSLAARVMRVSTGRPLVILFERAYHGFGGEFSLAFENTPEDALAHVVRVPWNDVAKFETLLKEKFQSIAGIIMNPLDQSPAKETIEASPEFLAAISRAQLEYGLILTLDDVRHGFRLHPGGSHKLLQLDPDLICLGKALANGYATSALIGKNKLRNAASQIQFTATFMFSAVAYKAAMMTLDIYERDNVFTHLVNMGERLREGLYLAAERAGHQIRISGPSTMPSLLFGGERKGERARHFSKQAALKGAIFHPSLNWFISAAHQETDIDEAIEISEESFRSTPVK